MKKIVLWVGLVLLIGGGILVFISGTQDSSRQLVYPALNNLQSTWTILAVLGAVLTLIGIIRAIVARKTHNPN